MESTQTNLVAGRSRLPTSQMLPSNSPVDVANRERAHFDQNGQVRIAECVDEQHQSQTLHQSKPSSTCNDLRGIIVQHILTPHQPNISTSITKCSPRYRLQRLSHSDLIKPLLPRLLYLTNHSMLLFSCLLFFCHGISFGE